MIIFSAITKKLIKQKNLSCRMKNQTKERSASYASMLLKTHCASQRQHLFIINNMKINIYLDISLFTSNRKINCCIVFHQLMFMSTYILHLYTKIINYFYTTYYSTCYFSSINKFYKEIEKKNVMALRKLSMLSIIIFYASNE